MQAKAIVEKAPKGKYVLIEGSETDNNAHLFQKGQMNILDPLVKKGDIQIVFKQWSKDWNPAAALANMENALTANNNKINAVVAANDGTAGGVIQALTAQGLAGKIPVSGQDAELAAAQRIVEGTQTMTVYKPIKNLATKAAELAVKMAKGEDMGAGCARRPRSRAPRRRGTPSARCWASALPVLVREGLVGQRPFEQPGVAERRSRSAAESPTAVSAERCSSTPHPGTGAGGRSRTGTGLSALGILSPVRLPIPPLRRSRRKTGNGKGKTRSRSRARRRFAESRLPARVSITGGDGRIRTAE